MTDKRRYFRYEVMDYAIAYRFGDPIGTRCIVADVSLGGISLRSKEPIDEDEILDVVVGNGSAHGLSLRTKVRHCRQVEGKLLYSIGLTFLPLTHDQRMSIAEFVNGAFQRQFDSVVI